MISVIPLQVFNCYVCLSYSFLITWSVSLKCNMSSRILTLLQTVSGTISNLVFHACVRNPYRSIPYGSFNQPTRVIERPGWGEFAVSFSDRDFGGRLILFLLTMTFWISSKRSMLFWRRRHVYVMCVATYKI